MSSPETKDDNKAIGESSANIVVEEASNTGSTDSDKNEIILLKNKMDLDNIVRAASESSDPDQRLAAILTARQYLSFTNRNLPINDFIDSGIVPILINCLREHNQTALQQEAAWALANIASGTTEQTNYIVASGAVPLLVELLSSPDLDVCEQAVWALGNIACDCSQLRDFAIDHGLIQGLLSLINRDISISFLHIVTWVLVNLCRKKGTPPRLAAVQEILPTLYNFIHHTDTNVVANGLWALSYLADWGNEMIQMVTQNGIIPTLIPYLAHDQARIVTAAIHALGNIATGPNEQTEEILSHDALVFLPALLKHKIKRIRKEALRFLSNLAAGNQDNVQYIINSGLLPKIIENLSNGELTIQIEAALAITNFTQSSSSDQVLALINASVLPLFCNLLTCQDPNLIYIVLQGLKNMLDNAGQHVDQVVALIKSCDGLERIKELQYHENLEIYRCVNEIIERHFFTDTRYEFESNAYV